MQSGIYLITLRKEGGLPSYYVGQAVNVEARLRSHRWQLKAGHHHNSRLQACWDKHGKDCFEFTPLESCASDQLDACEQWWLDEMVGHERVFNFAADAVSPMRGKKFSEEHRRKLGATKLGKPGCTHSDDFKRSASERLKGKPKSPETRARMSAAQKLRFAMSPLPAGSLHHGAKPVVGICIKTGKTISLACMKDGEPLGFSLSKISACCRGVRPHHRGYSWSFSLSSSP